MKKTLLCFLLAATALLSAVASAETYAVIIGINDYPEPLDRNGNPLKDEDGNLISDDLMGCVNDSIFWKDLLIKSYGVKGQNIRMLLDKQATEANFIKEMRWLISMAKPGDRIFFSYSGHGAQVELADQPEEADGLTEVICLQDSLIPDNFFGEVAKNFRDAGIDATFSFDSCFSGGISRDVVMNGRILRNKAVPATRLNAKQKANHLTAIEGAGLTMAIATTRAIKSGSYAFLMASAEDQTSADVQFLNDKYPPQGAFTFIVKAILTDEPTISIEALIEEVKSALKASKFDQIPNAEYSDSKRPAKPVIG